MVKRETEETKQSLVVLPAAHRAENGNNGNTELGGEEATDAEEGQRPKHKVTSDKPIHMVTHIPFRDW